VALDAAAGTLLWRPPELCFGAPPVVANGVLYRAALVPASNPAETLLARDAHSGRERWHSLLDSGILYVTVSGQTLHAGGSSFSALRSDAGHVVWRYG